MRTVRVDRIGRRVPMSTDVVPVAAVAAAPAVVEPDDPRNDYITHLEGKVRQLEAELAKKPVATSAPPPAAPAAVAPVEVPVEPKAEPPAAPKAAEPVEPVEKKPVPAKPAAKKTARPVKKSSK